MFTSSPWHPVLPGGCRRCGRTDRPHQHRGLCTLCWRYLRSYGGLWRYPEVQGGAAAGNTNASAPEHLTHLARRWQRERRILDRAFLPGRWQPGYWAEDAERRAA